MKNSFQKLSKEDMKSIKGGNPPKTIWKCRDTATSPFVDVNCVDKDPTLTCGYNACFDTGVSCTNGAMCA